MKCLFVCGVSRKMITSSLESPVTTCQLQAVTTRNHPVQLQVSFHGFSQFQICGNDEDDNDDYDHGSHDAGPLSWSHMTIMMMLKMVLMTNDHNDFDHDHRMPALWGGCLLLSLISMACQCQAVSLAKADAVG